MEDDLTPDRDVSVGKEMILDQVKEEMRRRNLDPTLLVFKWTDEAARPLALKVHRGRNQEELVFVRADMEDWPQKRTIYGKYTPRILSAINRLLQERS